jgi:tetratricopeptide (TPR) repeat protein
MQVQRTFRSHALLLSIILLSCSTVVLLPQSVSASHQNPAPADFEALAKSATVAREAGHADEAIQDYRRAVETNPRWEEGWWYLGTLLYDADRFSEAIPPFQKLVELLPNAGAAWNFLGLCEFETKDYANSLEHLQKGLAFGDADDPDTARVAKYHLALLLIRAGEFDQAPPLLGTTPGQNDSPPQIKIALALAMLRVPLLPKEIDASHDALLNAAGEAASAVAQNNFAKALALFPSLLKDYPATPYLRYAYGKALASAGRDEEALKQQREEILLSPKSPLPWIETSQLELRLHHPQEALSAAQEALQRSPDSPALHKTLAQILQVLGREERAARQLALAKKLSPEKPWPEKRIALLYSTRPDGSFKENMHATAHSANDSGASSFEELSAQAAKAQAVGDVDHAIQSYQRALRLRPQWDEGRWNLAMLEYSAAHYPEAISELKKTVERQPNVGPAWAIMGLCEFEIKDYNNAFVHLQRSEQLGFGGSPEADGLARYHLAILEDRNSQFESAMQTLLPGTRSGTVAKEVQLALGMTLLHMPLLPDEVELSKISLVQSAGEIAALLVNSNYDQAFPKLEVLLKQYPSVPFLHYAYGTALAALSQFDEAELQLRAELKISPQSELPYVSLASLALKQYRPDEALMVAQRAVELAPRSAESHYVLGRAHLELGDDKPAVYEFEQASKLAPGSPEVHFNLAKAYAKAKLPEKAERERATFARLNALAEQRRSRSGNQAYKGSNDAIELPPARIETQNAAAPR